MGEFLYHAPCPKCGSRNNLAVYTDGVHCFGCNYHTNEKSINPRLHLKDNNKKNDINIRPLPPDFNYHIPEKGLKWLQQYHVTAQDMARHRMGWSEGGMVIFRDTPREALFAPCMIFPVYDVYGNLLMWQGRYFGNDPNVTKYYTRGAKDCLHIMGEGGIIILVEDFISALRIAKLPYRSIPLFGSTVNLDLLVRLNRITDRFMIWLDADKHNYAQTLAKRASQYYNFVKAIYTPLDPKCYAPMEIQNAIEFHYNSCH